MPYAPNGSLTTDKRVVDDTTTWDAQSDWEAYQSQNNVEIVNGAVQLAEIPAVDNFEASLYGDQNNTLSDYYSGDLSAFSRQQSTVQEGSYALQSDTADNAGYSLTSVSGDGLPDYPRRGDRVRAAVRMGDPSGLVFVATSLVSTISGGSIGQTQSYAIQLNVGGNEICLYKNTAAGPNDGRNVLNSASVSLSEETWYDVEIYPRGDGTIEGAIYDTITDDPNATPIVTVSASDSEYDAPGVAIEANSTSSAGSTIYTDYMRIV